MDCVSHFDGITRKRVHSFVQLQLPTAFLDDHSRLTSYLACSDPHSSHSPLDPTNPAPTALNTKDT